MISIIVPFYNEKDSVHELHQRILATFQKIKKPFEIIFVDDGSADGTFEAIMGLSPVRVMRLRRNFGQTAAFACGIQNAKGDIIVTMDGDLENHPEDIPLLLQKLEEGYDVVSGWRQKRWSSKLLSRRLPSVIANWLISRITKIKLHDHGCNLRAYKRSAFKNISFLNGDMHRMLAAYLGMNGAKIAEIPVSYTERKFGKSKYGLSRTFKVILDILAFHFFQKYSSRPMHFFGWFGFIGIGAGLFTFILALYLRIFQDIHFNRTPLPELVAIFIVVGFQFILMGLLAEIMIRLSDRNKNSLYEIKDEVKKKV